MWQKLLLLSAVAVGVLILLVVFVIAFVLRSDTAHQYILRTAQQRATAALGTRVQIRDYTLNFTGTSPTLDLYDVVIDGAAPYPQPSLLTVDHARVGVRIVSLLQKKWYLSEAVVSRPVVRIFVDKQGKDNLPEMESTGQEGSTNLFDLAVQHASLEKGEVYYNNRKSVIDADLHEVDFRSNFDNSNPRYYGTLAYRNGRLKLENFDTISHDFSGRFEYAPDRFVVNDAVLRSGSSYLKLDATVRNLNQPDIEGQYSARLDTGEIRRILRNATLPVGTVNLNGSLVYSPRSMTPMFEAVDLKGELSSNQLQLRTRDVNASLRDLAASYSVRNGDLQVRNLRGQLMGGTLTGELTMKDLSGASRSNLSAALRGVSLAEAKSMINSPAMAKLNVSGKLNAEADATWGKTFQDLVARVTANLNASFAPAGAGAQKVPVNAVVHARYLARTQQLSLTDSFVRAPQTSANLDGTIGERSALKVSVLARDLHELEAITAMFQAAPQPLGVYGAATFNGSVTGSITRPNIRGRLTASNLRVKGSSWRSLRTDVDASPFHVRLRDGEIVAMPRGRIDFNLQTSLSNWAFTDLSEFQLSLNGDQLNIANLVRAAGSTAPASGTLKINAQARGTQLAPVGDGTIELTNAKIAGEVIQSANVKFRGTGDVIRTNLALRLRAGAADGTIDYFPKKQAYEANVRANGIRLEQLETVKARNLGLTGVLNLNAAGRGTLNDPQLTATAAIPELSAQGQKISGIILRADVANHVARLNVDSRVIDTSLKGQATINLSGEYPIVATFDTGTIPLQPLVALYAPQQAADLTGQAEVHARLRGPLKDKSAIEAQVEIPTLAVNYRNAVQIGAPQPIRMEYRNGVLQVARSAIRGTGTDLQFQGRVPIMNSADPMSLLLQGTMDLRLARVFNPDVETTGQLVFDINSFGNRANPNVQGQVRIVNASVATGDMPLGLQNGNGVVTVTRERLEVTRFEGTVGGGRVQASGGVRYRPEVNFDLALVAEGIRLLYPEGLRSGLGGNVTLTGTREAASLRGQVNIEQVSFTPDFDLMGMMGSFGGTTAAPPSQGFSNNVQLELSVRSPEGISLVSRELSLSGGMNLDISGTAAQPVVLGRVTLNSGDLIFRGNRYLLQNATVDFVNPTRTEPVLNASVETTVQQYNIAMHFQGPVERMRTSYTSDPALPPADIINLLAFGKTTEAAAANPNPPGQLGAQSAIASAVAGQVTSRLEKVAGISHLSIDPTLGGTGSSSQSGVGATVTVQQRVTSKLFVTFSTDVTSTERQVIQLEYRVNPRFSFSGTRDQNGGFAVDTRFRKRW